jgi:hypothetical protein
MRQRYAGQPQYQDVHQCRKRDGKSDAAYGCA